MSIIQLIKQNALKITFVSQFYKNKVNFKQQESELKLHRN